MYIGIGAPAAGGDPVRDGVDNASRVTPDEATKLVRHLGTPISVLGVEPPPRAAAPGAETRSQFLARKGSPA